MKKLLFILPVITLALGLSLSVANAYTSVRGYYRNNGTYVQPYVRSSPNSLKYDNYGYTGGARYNNSYSNPSKDYSSSWYQPSQVTDPNYYTGKNIYNSRH